MPDTNTYPVWPGWETVALIGQGSFGAVYEIERDVLGEREKAAMKVITIPRSTSEIDDLIGSGYDDESITETFREQLRTIIAEYSLMRKLNGNSNVVNCDDVRYVQHPDNIGWDIFIKMELLTPLNRSIGSHLSEQQVIRLGRDICQALVLCKRHDIIHRDIKPANIFVSPSGDYKLGDFGVAKTMERTTGGTKIGTYDYMAPEVYNNRPYSQLADIYSLGMVLYWMLNDRRTPFLPPPPATPNTTQKQEARDRRFAGEPLPPPNHGSRMLQSIVLKACAYDPKDRYQSAEDMLADLEDLMQRKRSPKKTPVGTEPANGAGPIGTVPAGSRSGAAAASAGGDSGSTPTVSAVPAPSGNPLKKRIIAAAAGVLLLIGVLGAVFRDDIFPDAGNRNEVASAQTSPSPRAAVTAVTAAAATSTPSPSPESTPEPTATPTPEPTPTPTPRPVKGVSASGNSLKDIVYDEYGRIQSLSEKIGNKWIKWTYCYSYDGEFAYRVRNIGGVSAKLGKAMPGTGSASYILSSPLENCVGFTLGYQVTYLKKGNCTGTRDVYMRIDGSQWIEIGSFEYKKLKAYVTTVFAFDEPFRLEAVAAPRRKEDDSHFQFDYTLTDVLVADYDYVEPVPAS